MNILLTAFVLLWAASSAVTQSGPGVNDRGATAGDGRLELTASVKRQRYCSDGDMLLLLRLGYRNTGNADLVLFKYAITPYEYSVSRGPGDTAAKRFEQVVNPMTMSTGGDMKLGDKPPPDYFVTLKPGETYLPDFDTILPMFLHKGDEPNCEPTEGGDCESGLGPGRHVLQLSVRTWPLLNDPDSALLSLCLWEGRALLTSRGGRA
ncbi:MAG: hypothetical protein ACJ754_07245 [Pyrinomonadaceae bacterium]